MIILELLVFTVGLVYFWLRTDAKTDDGASEQPHLRLWGRFYPK
jgi:hypothetical protein